MEVDRSGFRLLDQGSAGGTYVNGARVAEHALQPGDVVRMGSTELRLELEAAPEASTLVGAAPPPVKAAPQPVPLKQLVGQAIGPFAIKKLLATGQRGVVFLADDTAEHRQVALKVLWPDVAQREEEIQRFVRAMKTMLPIRHENIVQIYSAGKTGQHVWIAMEYVEGESLTQVIRRIGTKGMLDWRYAFRVAVHIGRALEEAYRHQVIHRNITPANILIREKDQLAKLGDLMLAKALEGTLARPVTRPGQLVGDIVYMPPERTRVNAPVDCRADIYSLGATLYALLTGRPPFEGDSLPHVIANIRNEQPVKPKTYQLSVSDMFQDVVMQMLAKRPEDRYENPSLLLKDLQRVALFHNVQV
ncbi:MAG: protein kinase [Pirellulales bacterium]|nr:protein kinase [Pirellulales bacterium]